MSHNYGLIAIRYISKWSFPQNIGGILLLGEKSNIWEILFKIYKVSKSIYTSSKILKFCWHFRATIPHGQYFWKLNFLIWRDKIIGITRKKSSWVHIMLTHKYYNDITGKNEALHFWGSCISLLLQGIV